MGIASSVPGLSTKPVKYDVASGEPLFVNVPLDPETAVEAIATIRRIFPPIEGMSHLSMTGFVATIVKTVLSLEDGQSLTRAEAEKAVLDAVAKSLADAGRTDPRIIVNEEASE